MRSPWNHRTVAAPWLDKAPPGEIDLRAGNGRLLFLSAMAIFVVLLVLLHTMLLD